MHCSVHGRWHCTDYSCGSFYQQQGYTFSGIHADFDLSTGGFVAAEDLGGGLAIDLSNGDLAIETPFGLIDL